MFASQDDKRSYLQEWNELGDIVAGTYRPAADPRGAGYMARRSLGIGPDIVCGRVLDGVAYTGCYRVAFERGRPILPCVFAGPTSFMPIGARQANSLVPGTIVWVLVHNQLSYGVILTAEPGWITDPVFALSAQIHQASRCGLRVDSAHHSVLRLAGNGTVIDWSAGRPWDGTLVGEWGAITETGIRVTVDSFMAQLAVDEACGVTAFYDDALLRVAGYGLQVITAGSEEETHCDGAEIAVYRGSTPYPWEQSGVLDRGTDPYRDLTAQEAQISQPYYSAVEPVEDRQQPFHRVVELGGYLAQGGRRMVLLPPPGAATYVYGGGTPPPAVYEEFTTLPGRHVQRSAKGIFLIKSPVIPGPKRAKRIEAKDGDNADNYRFAGIVGSGPEHKVVGDLDDGDVAPHIQQAAAAFDTISYACNWEGVHALHYHKLDWDLPQESETKAHTGQQEIAFGTLATEFYLPRPDAVTQHVDHRYGDVHYYQNTSYLGLLDDGGTVFGDGFASERKSTGGSIWETAAGDIHIKAGRNIVLWAGGDIVLRAKNSIDLSATEHDIRIKAERNCQILGGNDNAVGSVLIESRGPAVYGYTDKVGEEVVAGGVQIKSKNGEFAALASGIYLRTGGGDVRSGAITLDADRGKQAIYTNSRSFTRYLGEFAIDHFGDDGNVQGTNYWSKATNELAGGIIAGNTSEILAGGLLVRGNIDVDQGHIATQNSKAFNGLVGSLEGASLAAVAESIDQAIESERDLIDSGITTYQAAFLEFWYGAGRPGEDNTVRAIAFSFRNAAQYRTTDFRLFEDRWQQMARLTSGAPATWTEKPVQAGSAVTYPYPGREKWVDEATYIEQDLTLYDQAAGTAKTRSPDTYGAPKFTTGSGRTPDGSYAVVF